MTDGNTGEPTTCGRIAGHDPRRDGYPGHKSADAAERDRERRRVRTALALATDSVCTRAGCSDIAPVGRTRCPAHDREAHNKWAKARYRRDVDGLIRRLGGHCVICGSTQRLEFDHVDWRTKNEEVTMMVARRADPGLIDAELRKCQLLCRAHHTEKTRIDRAEQRAEKRAAA